MQGLLLASFGTTDHEALARDIGGWEQAVREAFPQRQSFRAFTSGVVRNRLKTRQGLEVDSPDQALEKIAAQGYDDLLIVSGHILPGIEYDKLLQSAARHSSLFRKIYIARPLMHDAFSIHQVFTCACGVWDPAADTMHVLFGHGSDHAADSIYQQLETEFDEFAPGYTVGTVEGQLALDAVIKRLEDRKRKKVVLHPLMLVAGDHARNDMAGEDEESWLSILTDEGYQVQAQLEGLGAQADFCRLFIQRGQAALSMSGNIPHVFPGLPAGPGRFYLAGVGPGAPDLLTVRAAELLRHADVLAYPYSKKSDKQVALDAARPYLPADTQQLPLLFPMTVQREELDAAWDQAARQVAAQLDAGKNTVFITIGDAMLYSTGLYLAQRLATAGYAVEVVPGVPSFCAAAAATLTPLAQEDEVFVVLPLARTKAGLDGILDQADCVAVLKPSSRLADLQSQMEGRGLTTGAVCVSFCGTADESVLSGEEILQAEALPYLSTLLLHKHPARIKDNR